MIRQKDMDISMANKKRKLSLTLSALGVVYGDIGTSPLYALRESLRGMPLTTINILGVLSLILWSLILVISIKYLLIVFRADNEGEGGSLALLALLKQKKSSHEYLFYLLAIFGAGLLIGDGMLTPAISVSSAIEGLHVISPAFDAYIVPLSCVIMLFLFMIQSNGTTKIGHAFGPILLVWFITIAVLGLSQILKTPFVLKAFNPFYAYHFLWTHSTRGYFLVGGDFFGGDWWGGDVR
jgi:KUP system potassium uptake protein